MFPFGGNGRMSLAAGKKCYQKSLKDCACLMKKILAADVFELQLVSSHVCSGFLIKSRLCQEVNGHYC